MAATPRSAQAVAEARAARMWADDPASRSLGMEILLMSPGSAELAMTVRPDMVNGHGLAHGGFIFTLADSAFAFAVNSYGDASVAAQCQITYLKPARAGDRLVARAREVSRLGRSGIYDVSVSVDGDVVAEFRGHSRTVGPAPT